MLGRSDVALCRAYDLAMLDLDGVVYVGRRGGARRARSTWPRPARRACGWPTSPTTPPGRPGRVAEHLRELGVEAAGRRTWSPRPRPPPGCWSSGSARARRSRCWAPRASSRRSSEEGLVPGAVAAEDAARRRHGLRAGRALARHHAGGRPGARRALVGAPATPTARSRRRTAWRPGHGMLVEHDPGSSAGVEPVVAGKPERPLLDETVRRVGGKRPLMVGDRLDTDIEGARKAGCRLAAGADRGDRPGRAGGGGPGAATHLPRGRPGRAARAARRRPRSTAGSPRSAAGRGRVESGRLALSRAGERRRLVAGGGRRGLAAPRRDRCAGRRGRRRAAPDLTRGRRVVASGHD